MTDWSIAQAREIYNIEHWSDGFFHIDDNGDLLAYPDKNHQRMPIHFPDLVKKIVAMGLPLPVLIRFTDILHQRVRDLFAAFQQAMQEHRYQNIFTPVYPIKVNQQPSVVTELLASRPGEVGLEAGSKPELMAVLGLSKINNSLILCNGYKDREYIRLALIGLKLGHRIFIIVEKSSELDLILEEAEKLQVEPVIGIRVRPASVGAGKWQNTGGERGKFGLSAAQVLAAIEKLRKHNQLHILQLLHFHMGSQVANIRDIQRVVHECARYYVELRRLGAPITCVDVGGGLGVDYEGTRSRRFCSINYTMQEYANNVVYALAEVCAETQQPHPQIITESGRAMVAHHAVLLMNVIDKEIMSEVSGSITPEADDPRILQDLSEGLETISQRSVLEAYHDATYWLAEAHTMYVHGLLTLSQRAKAEQIYRATCIKVRELLQQNLNRTNLSILHELNEKLADKYFCNFSIFQSVPDMWAIEQIFPVMPLSGLKQKPTQRVTLQDLTCDSDGQIKNYIDGQDIETTLPLPMSENNSEPVLGIFLVGAYQEILGDIHNLFGDTHSVHVELTSTDDYRLVQAKHGDRIKDVLRYVHFDPDVLLKSYQEQLSQAKLNPEEREQYFNELQAGLNGYTYFAE